MLSGKYKFYTLRASHPPPRPPSAGSGGRESSFSKSNIDMLLKDRKRGPELSALSSYFRISERVKASFQLPWSRSTGVKIYEYFHKHRCNYKLTLKMIKKRFPSWSGHIELFVTRLNYWMDYLKESGIQPYDTVDNIFCRCLVEGPAYAKYLKKLRAYSYIYKVALVTLEEVPMEFVFEEYSSYDSIFNQIFLPYFEEECSDIDDYMYTEESVKDSFIEEYIEMAKAILCNLEIVPDNIDEISMQLRTSSSFDVDKNLTKPHYALSLLKYPEGIAPADRLVCKKTKIPKAPGETRDAVTCTPQSMVTHKYLTSMLAQVCDQLDNSMMVRNKRIATSREKRLHKGKRFYTMIDFKKHGLTMPQKLMSATFQALHELYPEKGFEKGMDFYRNMEIHYDDGQVKFPKRGHALGYGNEHATISSIILYEIAKSRIPDEISGDVDALFLNDDAIISGELVEDLKVLLQKHCEVITEAGLNPNLGKSFITDGESQFCEEYTSTRLDMSKSTLLPLAMLSVLGCTNIVHAKTQLNSYSPLLDGSELEKKVIKEIIDYWGYEFYSKEVNRPFLLGGWLTDYELGFDLTLTQLDGTLREARACIATNVKFELPRRLKKQSKMKNKSMVPMLKGATLLDETYTFLKLVNKNRMFGNFRMIQDSYQFWRKKTDLMAEIFDIKAKARKRKWASCKIEARRFMGKADDYLFKSYNIEFAPREDHIDDHTGVYDVTMSRALKVPGLHYANPYTSYLNYLNDNDIIRLKQPFEADSNPSGAYILEHGYQDYELGFNLDIPLLQEGLDESILGFSLNYKKVLYYCVRKYGKYPLSMNLLRNDVRKVPSKIGFLSLEEVYQIDKRSEEMKIPYMMSLFVQHIKRTDPTLSQKVDFMYEATKVFKEYFPEDIKEDSSDTFSSDAELLAILAGAFDEAPSEEKDNTNLVNLDCFGSMKDLLGVADDWQPPD